MILCCAMAGLFAACDNDNDFPGIQTGTDGNSIILNISSASLPVSRAITAEGAEVAVSHIDVLIFDDSQQKNKVWSDRVSAPANQSGVITLAVKRETFSPNTRYWVYLIANSTHAKTDFDNLTDLAGLKGMTQADKNIHMTGLTGLTDVPVTFLMDGIAYPEGETEPVGTPAPVILYDGQKANDTELAVSLRRAAAKVVFTLNKGADVTFDNSEEAKDAGYYLRNMPYSTSVLPADQTFSADLCTTDKNAASYFSWSADKITVTAYMYAHSWMNASSFEQEPRLVVNIPMKYAKDADPDKVRPNNYYQIPLCKDKVLNRNTCYMVTATVNAPGAENPSNPTALGDIGYSVVEWDIETINIGGDDGRPEYLTLNRYDLEMHNMENDETTLIFTSSSKVEATVVEAYYYDKFGQKTPVSNSINSQITITPDDNVSGHIKIHSPNPTNNAIRYIVVEVKNEEGKTRTVTIEQYPLEYITNVEGWYSYRDDFVSTASDGTSGVTTWELLAGKKINKGTAYNAEQVPYDNRNAWICGCSWSENDKTWSYSKTGTGFFSSKVAYDFNTSTGLSDIEYARWTESRSRRAPYTYTYNTDYSSVGLNNHRMYHVVITASSGDYTLGRPRITDDKTDPGEDNAQLVSPSFMLASQLGAVFEMPDLIGAAEHCERYVEVSRDGKVYDDWRLPTKAEIEIIYKFQYDSDVMDEVLAGNRYWSASGLVGKPGVNNPDGSAIRCIRDAYDDKK